MDVTWKLRPGVKWHDGKPHTSADVKFTVDAINKGDWKPESTDGFDRISSVDTPDSLTAVVHYKEIYAPYEMQFFRGTLPKHVLEGRDIDKANDYNRNPLGTGPYRRGRVEDGRVRAARGSAELLAWSSIPEDQADSLSLHRQHVDADQSAAGRRDSRRRAHPVGQSSRAEERAGDPPQPCARQRLRARHAQRAESSRRSPTCASVARLRTRSTVRQSSRRFSKTK